MAPIKFALAPHAMILEDGDTLLLFIEREMLRIDSFSASSRGRLRQTLARLVHGCEPDELHAMLHDADVHQLMSQLMAMDAIVRRSGESSGGATHWERQLGFLCGFGGDPDQAQRRLRQVHVAIIGVGGVGCIVLQHLLGAGVRRIDVIDSDVVALHNLNRQYIFQRSDIGRLKVDVASEYAYAIAPDAEISRFATHVSAASDLALLDADPPGIIVLAADHPVHAIQGIVNEYCMARAIPFIGAAVGLSFGYWGPLIVPGVTCCHICFDALLRASMSDEERRLGDVVRSVTPYSFGPHNSIISSHLAADVVAFIAGGKPPSLGARLTLDFAQLSVRHFPVPSCNCLHRDHPGVASAETSGTEAGVEEIEKAP